MAEVTNTTIKKKVVHRLLTLATNLLIVYKRLFFKTLIIRKNTSDHMVFRDIFLLKEFKLPVKIDPKLILDLGAYTGLSTLYYSKKFPNAKIISVEPETSNFKLLVEHTKNNPNITTINKGIWSSDAKLKIENKNSEKWAFTLTEVEEDEPYDIVSVTIDTLLSTSGSSVIDILKIDIEGSEKEIFSKNYEPWINKVNIIVIELHDRMIEGCTETLNSAIDANLWKQYKSGEKVILVRNSFISAS